MSKVMGQRIHNKRVELGLTMEELGRLVGVTRQSICKWEKGEVKDIPRDHIKRMADIFHCEKSWLMNMDDASEVTLTYEAPDKEPVRVKVTGEPILGERTAGLRAQLYQAAVKVRPENLETAIEILKSLQ